MNQLPYTVDFKSEAVRENQQGTADPFSTFFKSVERYSWTSPTLKAQHKEAREKLELALSIPIVEQARLSAISFVSTFVQDVALREGAGKVREDTIKRLTFDSVTRHGEIITRPDNMTTYVREHLPKRNVLGFNVEVPPDPPFAWSSYKPVPPGDNDNISSTSWKIEPVEDYGEEMPTHAIRIAGRLKEYGAFPHLGRFWVASPGAIAMPDPILYFQVLRRFVYLADWV